MKRFLLIVLLFFSPYHVAADPVLLSQSESRIKVAILDTGIFNHEAIRPYLCNDHHYDFTHTSLVDQLGHGTNVAAIIARNLDKSKVCIQIVKYVVGAEDFDMPTYLKALKQVVNDSSVLFINISAGGYGYNVAERILMEDALQKGKYVMVAAGNRSENLSVKCDYYPACYQFLNTHFRVIGSGVDPKNRSMFSNYGIPVTNWMNGENVCEGIRSSGREICYSGTSQATALFTNYIIKKYLKEF